MNHLTGTKHRQALILYLIILAMAAVGAGLSDNVLSNYFKDAYQVTAFQRGLIEIPREAPGVIGVLIVTALVSLGDIRIAAIAQALMIAGLLLLGFLTPIYSVMLVFIFIHSLGGHIWYPLQDSIGMVRALYLRNIALKPSDIGPTLTMGQSMDHVVSILCATLGGLVWSAWGPQYVFFLAALFSGINFVVARLANINEN